MSALGRLIVASACVASGVAAATPPSFEAVMSVHGEFYVALSDPASSTAHWVRVGETFRGQLVQGYEATSETLILVKDSIESRVRLKTVRIRDGSAAREGSGPGPVQGIYDNLHQLKIAAAHFCRDTGNTSARFADLVGPDKYIEVLRPVSGEDYGTLRIEQGRSSLSVTTATGETVTFDTRAQSQTDTRFHLTTGGDSIEQIAAAAGNSVQRILELNELAEPGAVRTGRLLRTN